MGQGSTERVASKDIPTGVMYKLSLKNSTRLSQTEGKDTHTIKHTKACPTYGQPMRKDRGGGGEGVRD